MTVQIAEIEASAESGIGTVRIVGITAERDVASLGTVRIHGITAEVDDVADPAGGDFRVARSGRWQLVLGWSAAATPRRGDTATAADATTSDYLVTGDADADGIAIGDRVRLHHADGTAIDADVHTISATESAFGFTNLHITPVAPAGFVAGDYLMVVGSWT